MGEQSEIFESLVLRYSSGAFVSVSEAKYGGILSRIRTGVRSTLGPIEVLIAAIQLVGSQTLHVGKLGKIID